MQRDAKGHEQQIGLEINEEARINMIVTVQRSRKGRSAEKSRAKSKKSKSTT